MSCSKLILIDGMAAVYRAFYAIRELSTKSGKPTNAVFGFIRMLNQIKEMRDPSHLMVVFDGGLPEERLSLHKEYKANRAPTPDLLKEQVPVIEDYLDRADIPWVRHQGQEADDLIASIAKSSESLVEATMIATGDKDIYQVVNNKITIIPVSGAGDALDVEGVKLKTGVSPEQIIDWLALIGDNADNIPGVPGVGPKTATKLLEAYGSLDGIWAHVDEVKGDKLRDSLKGSKDLVSRNVQMVRLNLDIDVPLDWAKMKVTKPDPGKLLPFFQDMEFHSMAKQISEGDLFDI